MSRTVAFLVGDGHASAIILVVVQTTCRSPCLRALKQSIPGITSVEMSVFAALLVAVAFVGVCAEVETLTIGADGVSEVAKSAVFATTAGGVDLNGFFQPTSVSWDDCGHVFVALKVGTILVFPSWTAPATAAATIVDIENVVSSFGDHGLTSILWDRDEGGHAWLYATYMKNRWTYGGANCNDYGQQDGRVDAAIEGCDVYGALSRWPVDDTGTVTGPEHRILDTQINKMACAQFSTHSIPACVVKGAAGDFFVSFGDGAGFSSVDNGNHGHNPCSDNPGYEGVYRAQDPVRWNGKVLRLNAADGFVPHVFSVGHRNPFRLTVSGSELWESETGWFTHEEINHIQEGHNYGWPCYEGPTPTEGYDLLGVAAARACPPLMVGTAHTPPAAFYGHPPIQAMTISSISAIAVSPSHIYFGDWTMGWIKRVPRPLPGAPPLNLTNGAEIAETLLNGVSPCELKFTPDGTLVYVSHSRGLIGAVSLVGGAVSPAPIPSVPTAALLPSTLSYTPGVTNVVYGSTTNLAGREGVVYTWTALLLTECGITGPGTCAFTWLFKQTLGATLAMTAPWSPLNGTLEVSIEVNTQLGASLGLPPAVATATVPSTGHELCVCTGGRVIAAPLPPAPSTIVPDIPPNIIGGVNGVAYRPNAPLPAPPAPAIAFATVSDPSGASTALGAATSAIGAVVVSSQGQTTWDATSSALLGFSAVWSGAPTDVDGSGGKAAIAAARRLAPAQFLWDVYVVSGCGAPPRASPSYTPVCGFTHITTVGRGAGPVLTLTPPLLRVAAALTNATLLVQATAVSPDGRAGAVGTLHLPATGALAACTCAGAGTAAMATSIALSQEVTAAFAPPARAVGWSAAAAPLVLLPFAASAGITLPSPFPTLSASPSITATPSPSVSTTASLIIIARDPPLSRSQSNEKDVIAAVASASCAVALIVAVIAVAYTRRRRSPPNPLIVPSQSGTSSLVGSSGGDSDAQPDYVPPRDQAVSEQMCPAGFAAGGDASAASKCPIVGALSPIGPRKV